MDISNLTFGLYDLIAMFFVAYVIGSVSMFLLLANSQRKPDEFR